MKKTSLFILIFLLAVGCDVQYPSPYQKAVTDTYRDLISMHWGLHHDGRFYYQADKTLEQCETDYENNIFEAKKATASSNDPIHNAKVQSELLVAGMKKSGYELVEQNNLPENIRTIRLPYNNVGLAGK